jgi:hypothetical protein
VVGVGRAGLATVPRHDARQQGRTWHDGRDRDVDEEAGTGLPRLLRPRQMRVATSPESAHVHKHTYTPPAGLRPRRPAPCLRASSGADHRKTTLQASSLLMRQAKHSTAAPRARQPQHDDLALSSGPPSPISDRATTARQPCNQQHATSHPHAPTWPRKAARCHNLHQTRGRRFVCVFAHTWQAHTGVAAQPAPHSTGIDGHISCRGPGERTITRASPPRVTHDGWLSQAHEALASQACDGWLSPAL